MFGAAEAGIQPQSCGPTGAHREGDAAALGPTPPTPWLVHIVCCALGTAMCIEGLLPTGIADGTWGLGRGPCRRAYHHKHTCVYLSSFIPELAHSILLWGLL